MVPHSFPCFVAIESRVSAPIKEGVWEGYAAVGRWCCVFCGFPAYDSPTSSLPLENTNCIKIELSLIQYEMMKEKSLLRAEQHVDKTEHGHERKKKKSKSRSVAARIGLDAAAADATGFV